MPFLTSKTENRDFKQKDTKINSKKTYLILRLWKYMYEYKWLLFIAAVLSIGSNLFALIGPALSGYAVDAIVPGVGKVDFPKVYYYALLMLLFYIASAVMTYFLSRIMIKLSRSVVYKMRKDVFNRLVTLPVGFFDRRQTGDIISIISYDIDTINTSLSNDLLQVLTSIITVVGSFVMMLSISKKLILVFAFTVPASILFTRYRTKKVRPLFRIRSSKLGELNGFIEEMTGGRKTIKAYHQEKTILDRFDEKNTQAVDAYFKADYYSSMTGPSMNFI
jgi:ATP-binding cassette subfamily B protein